MIENRRNRQTIKQTPPQSSVLSPVKSGDVGDVGRPSRNEFHKETPSNKIIENKCNKQINKTMQQTNISTVLYNQSLSDSDDWESVLITPWWCGMPFKEGVPQWDSIQLDDWEQMQQANNETNPRNKHLKSPVKSVLIRFRWLIISSYKTLVTWVALLGMSSTIRPHPNWWLRTKTTSKQSNKYNKWTPPQSLTINPHQVQVIDNQFL